MNRLKRVNSGVAAGIIGLSSLMTIGFTGVAHAISNTCTWTGTGGDSKFSTATNWTGCNSTAPQAGDVIAFKVLGSNNATYTLNNDLTVNLGGVIYGDSSVGAINVTGYTLSKLHLADGAVITQVNAQGSQYSNVHVNTGTDYTAAGDLTLNGFIGSSNGGSSILTPHNLTILAGGAYTNASGGVAFQQYNPTGVVTIATGGTYVGTGTEASIVVQNGGSFSPYAGDGVKTYSVPITYGGGSDSANPSLVSYAGDMTLSGAQTLNHNVDVEVDGTTVYTVTGALNGSFTMTKTAGSSGTLIINSSSNTSSSPNGTQDTAVTTTTVSDSQNISLDVPNKSTTILDGTRNQVGVDDGGLLKGTGTATVIYVYKGGTVAPGHSPGKLTVLQNLSLGGGSTYQAELKDSADGDYDQIVVGNASQTGNTQPAVTLGDFDSNNAQTLAPILVTSLYTGYNIKVGDKFTIIDNKSGTNVLGTFANLAEGATYKVGNGTFSISYKGGDGNDVVLTALTVPTAPNTGFTIVANHPGITLAVTASAAIMIVAISKRLRPVPVRVRASSRANRRRR